MATGGRIRLLTLGVLDRDILSLFSRRIRELTNSHFSDNPAQLRTVREIRLRKGLPVCVVYSGGDALLLGQGFSVSDDDIDNTLALVTDSSYYALENEFANGYITIPGGHRVGLAGQVVTWADGSTRLREISGFNFRIAREVKGIAEALVPKLLKGGILASTLIVSPPGSGKTTLLRDLCRVSSVGLPGFGLRPSQVGIVDERSEIAACFRGVPQHDVGPRTDVLDRCPKAKGMMMLLRSMGPELVATDEIGSDQDAQSMAVALASGVVVLATCHGDDLDHVKKRPYASWMLEKRYFEKAIVLSGRLGPGTLEYIGDVK